jgi:hypothetical protein
MPFPASTVDRSGEEQDGGKQRERRLHRDRGYRESLGLTSPEGGIRPAVDAALGSPLLDGSLATVSGLALRQIRTRQTGLRDCKT